MSSAKCIMVQGTMSGAGKSLLCAALCRIFAQDGYKTAPFKSQNMALNSFVTRDGLEMGRAQVVQAQAAGVEPDVRMNPILLKPSSDIGSQVIVNGEVRGNMPAKEYFRHKRALIPDILQAYNSLAEEFDIIVIEGAGSPAEINLKADGNAFEVKTSKDGKEATLTYKVKTTAETIDGNLTKPYTEKNVDAVNGTDILALKAGKNTGDVALEFELTTASSKAEIAGVYEGNVVFVADATT